MNSILNIPEEELQLVINNTADRLHLSPAIIEKDIWVCIVLEYLFSVFAYRGHIVFKGGTSLSKVYHIIERFSEDIDLALDWKVLGYAQNQPYEDRSNTAQQRFNEALNEDTKVFLKEKMLPILQNDFKSILNNRKFEFYMDWTDEQTICFDYPKYHSDSSILQVIRLEIGCLAEPVPAEEKTIKSYVSEAYPEVFSEEIKVVAVDSLRTFYEKITILHKEANRTNGKYPQRYSRHFYDVYKMLQTDLKYRSLERLDLLYSVVAFKKKFYASHFARYDEIMQGNIKLVPGREAIEAFSKDYEHMKNMLFGERIPFEEIIKELAIYEKELNRKLGK